MDPNVKVARNHLIDFSIQRELPGHNLVELGYIGRLGRRLGNAVGLTTPPYMHKDPASGQSFAQAFDCVAQVLRGLPPPASPFPCTSSTGALLPQPGFENQLSNPAMAPWGAGPDGCNDGSSNTACIAFLDGGGNFVPGNISITGGLFTGAAFPGSPFIDNIRKLEGLPQFSNHQQQDLEMHQSHDWSDYHALTATWRNSGWVKGLEFDLNYTFSKAMDNGGNHGPSSPTGRTPSTARSTTTSRSAKVTC